MNGETQLSRELRAHRAGHPSCDIKCQEYLAIVRQFTATRIRWAGPTAPRHILSVQEAR